jgi:hypothetical protein
MKFASGTTSTTTAPDGQNAPNKHLLTTAVAQGDLDGQQHDPEAGKGGEPAIHLGGTRLNRPTQPEFPKPELDTRLPEPSPLAVRDEAAARRWLVRQVAQRAVRILMEQNDERRTE